MVSLSPVEVGSWGLSGSSLTPRTIVMVSTIYHSLIILKLLQINKGNMILQPTSSDLQWPLVDLIFGLNHSFQMTSSSELNRLKAVTYRSLPAARWPIYVISSDLVTSMWPPVNRLKAVTYRSLPAARWPIYVISSDLVTSMRPLVDLCQ